MVNLHAQTVQQAKAELLRRAGHGARNSLNGVAGLAGLLGSPGVPQDADTCAAIAQSAGELRTLLQPLIDLAIAEPGLPNEPSTFPVRLLLQDIAAFHDLLARGRAIRVSCALADAVPPTLRTDRLKFLLLVHLLAAQVVAACAEGAQVRIAMDSDGNGHRLTIAAAAAAQAGPGVAPGDAASGQADFLAELLEALGASVTRVQGTAGLQLNLPLQ